MMSSSFKLLILYAGETGNCEDLAKRIGWQGIKRGFKILAYQLDDYDALKLIEEELVLFICSTTNQGDEPCTMRKFWNFIMRKGLPNDVLCNLRCGVIGLGDSSYLKYNVVGKKLYKRLINLGANMLMNICLGDDQHDLGLDAAVDKWLPDFWSKIEECFSNDDSIHTSIDEHFKLYNVKQLENNESIDNELIYDDDQVFDQKNYYTSRVISNLRVTSDDHFQDTRFLKLSILHNNESLNYKPGDVVMILPQNSDETVNQFIDLLKLDSNEQVIINKLNKEFLGFNLYDTIENKPIQIGKLVKQYFDLSSVPKRSFFEVLATYSTDQLEKDKLNEFASTNGQYALYEYCKKPKRTLLEVLIDFPKTTSNLKINDLLQLINPIFPRPYSIASSQIKHPNELHVLCAVKQLKTLLKKPRLGLCSNYIKRLKIDDKVSIYIKKGTLKISDTDNPLIMIGPGTGVAPLRSIIEDRICKNISLNYLFFGCRYRSKDFYFENEWKEANKCSNLNYFVAFSRDQPNHKMYVQDKLYENRELIWRLINEQDANLIVCGSSSQMPNDVRDMLIKIIKDQAPLEIQNKAELLIDRFEISKRLQFECWD